MRAALLTVLLVAGCSNKSETAKQTPEDKAGEKAATTVEATKPGAERPAEPAPAEPKQADPKPAMTVDCSALLTAEDVANACGGSKVDVTEHQSPAKHPATACARKMTEPGKDFPIGHVQVLVFDSSAATDGWIKLDRTADAKDLAGVGDMAWTRVKERPQLKSTDYDVGVRKGNAVLKLSSTQGRLVKKVPCTIDQLGELARTIAARMP